MNTESIITSIEKQKKSNRYNIFVNEEYAFSVHEDILIKYRLGKGKSLDPLEWKDILQAEERNRACQYAFTYLNYRARTEAEVMQYLTRKGFTVGDCREAVAECRKHGFLNDERYAEQWIEYRKRSRPKGKQALRMELLYKGIDENVVEDQLAEGFKEGEEEEMIEALLEKKLKDSKFENSFEMKKKIVPYLQRKGFSLEQILSVIHKRYKDFLSNQES